MNKIAMIGCSVFALLISGCATNFYDPIKTPTLFKHEPSIQITMQGSVPPSMIYRERFYTTNTNITPREFALTAEIVAQIVGELLKNATEFGKNATDKHYDFMKNIYRWRTDVYIYGYTNLNEKEIMDIMKYGTRPQFDGQRSPFIGGE